MSVWKRTIIVVAKLIGGFLVVIVGILAVSILVLYKSDVDVRRFGELPSTDTSHTLIIDVGNPSMPYGSHMVKVSVVDTLNETIVREKFRLSNDGANIGLNNIEARWIDSDNAEICLRGDEQADTLVSIQVSSRNVVKKDRGCEFD